VDCCVPIGIECLTGIPTECFFHAFTRDKVRRHYNIYEPGANFGMDSLLMCFCGCCMLCQQLNEMDLRDSAGHGGTGGGVGGGHPAPPGHPHGVPSQVTMVPAGTQVVYVQPGQPLPPGAVVVQAHGAPMGQYPSAPGYGPGGAQPKHDVAL